RWSLMVELCRSARVSSHLRRFTPRASETVSHYRRRGLGEQAVAGWSCTVHASGREAILCRYFRQHRISTTGRATGLEPGWGGVLSHLRERSVQSPVDDIKTLTAFTGFSIVQFGVGGPSTKRGQS